MRAPEVVGKTQRVVMDNCSCFLLRFRVLEIANWRPESAFQNHHVNNSWTRQLSRRVSNWPTLPHICTTSEKCQWKPKISEIVAMVLFLEISHFFQPNLSRFRSENKEVLSAENLTTNSNSWHCCHTMMKSVVSTIRDITTISCLLSELVPDAPTATWNCRCKKIPEICSSCENHNTKTILLDHANPDFFQIPIVSCLLNLFLFAWNMVAPDDDTCKKPMTAVISTFIHFPDFHPYWILLRSACQFNTFSLLREKSTSSEHQNRDNSFLLFLTIANCAVDIFANSKSMNEYQHDELDDQLDEEHGWQCSSAKCSAWPLAIKDQSVSANRFLSLTGEWDLFSLLSLCFSMNKTCPCVLLCCGGALWQTLNMLSKNEPKHPTIYGQTDLACKITSFCHQSQIDGNFLSPSLHVSWALWWCCCYGFGPHLPHLMEIGDARNGAFFLSKTSLILLIASKSSLNNWRNCKELHLPKLCENIWAEWCNSKCSTLPISEKAWLVSLLKHLFLRLPNILLKICEKNVRTCSDLLE